MKLLFWICWWAKFSSLVTMLFCYPEENGGVWKHAKRNAQSFYGEQIDLLVFFSEVSCDHKATKKELVFLPTEIISWIQTVVVTASISHTVGANFFDTRSKNTWISGAGACCDSSEEILAPNDPTTSWQLFVAYRCYIGYSLENCKAPVGSVCAFFFHNL